MIGLPASGMIHGPQGHAQHQTGTHEHTRHTAHSGHTAEHTEYTGHVLNTINMHCTQGIQYIPNSHSGHIADIAHSIYTHCTHWVHTESRLSTHWIVPATVSTSGTRDKKPCFGIFMLQLLCFTQHPRHALSRVSEWGCGSTPAGSGMSES